MLIAWSKTHKKFAKLFNHTKQKAEIRIQYHTTYKIDLENDLDRLTKFRHLERLEAIEENCFVSPVVITVKGDKSVNIALDSEKPKANCINNWPHMPNMEKLIHQTSNEL